MSWYSRFHIWSTLSDPCPSYIALTYLHSCTTYNKGLNRVNCLAYNDLFFSQASQRAGFLNHWIDWLITRTWPVQLFTIRPTGRIFFPLNAVPKLSGNRQFFACFTLPSMKSQHRFIAVHFKMARKVTVSKFSWVFEVLRVCLIVCNRGAVMAGNPVFLSS